ncbi:MAG: DUF1178 family protein [Minwuia sp.]|nr:DUF1178 family protein [Minwuia sp.]
MIRFDLKCPDNHVFEGWFGSSADYASQQDRGLLQCPICGNGQITKAPMAPNVASRKDSVRQVPVPIPMPAPESTATPDSAPVAETSGGEVEITPERMVAMMRTLRRHVEQNADHVGTEFAEEARKIHYGEAPERGIYGDATEAEVEELQDEGIDVGAIPWLPDSDH